MCCWLEMPHNLMPYFSPDGETLTSVILLHLSSYFIVAPFLPNENPFGQWARSKTELPCTVWSSCFYMFLSSTLTSATEDQLEFLLGCGILMVQENASDIFSIIVISELTREENVTFQKFCRKKKMPGFTMELQPQCCSQIGRECIFGDLRYGQKYFNIFTKVIQKQQRTYAFSSLLN